MVSKEDTYSLEGVKRDLTEHGYSVFRHPNENDSSITVLVHEKQTAGGELLAVLNWWGYIPAYPKPYDGDKFCMEVSCYPVVYTDGFRKIRALLDNDTSIKPGSVRDKHIERCSEDKDA